MVSEKIKAFVFLFFLSVLRFAYLILTTMNLPAPIARNGVIRLLQEDGFLSAKESEAEVRIEQIQLEQVRGPSDTLQRVRDI